MTNKDFVHLHVHTHISMQDALPTPYQYAICAREMGFTAAAITDHGRMGGVVEFVDACRKPIKDLLPIKPIIGIEMYTCKDVNDKSKHINEDTGVLSREKYYHITLLAKNETGYRNLLKLSSLGHKYFYYFPRVDWSLIEQYHDGVIACSGCIGSELNQAILRGNYEEAENIVKRFKDLFGDDYYIEYQYHGMSEQKNVLPHLKNLSHKYNIVPIVSNDVHYLKKEDWKLHDLLISMRDLSENKRDRNNGKREAYNTHQFYLKNIDEMLTIFSKFDKEAIFNTVKMSDKIDDFMKIDVAPFLPKANVPTDDDNFVVFWNKNLPYNKPNEAYLAYLALSGMKKLGLLNNKKYFRRLQYELKTIWYSGVTDYFLIQYETCDFMKSNDIMFGIRGSGVGSLVNYCLGISSIDPVKWGLMFERFLNPGRGTQYKIDYSCYPVNKWIEENSCNDQSASLKRIHELAKQKILEEAFKKYSADIDKELWLIENQEMAAYLCNIADLGLKCAKNESQLWIAYFLGITDEMPNGELIVNRVATLPDIDTDIASDKREQVIAWAKQRFGEECVAQIGTRGTYKARSAVQYALKASPKFNKMFGENSHYKAQEISKTIPMRQVPPMTIEDALEESPEFLMWANKFPEEIKMASKITGTIQHLGIHAGGILISSEPITNVAPLENSKGILCSGYDMTSVERVGLVKYDFLGVKVYTAIAMALKFIEERHGKKINLNRLPLDDPEVFRMYHEGKTSTIFQCAGDGMLKQALQPIHIEKFEDIVAVIALYRPGPKAYIKDYAYGMKNPQSIKFSHELLQKHLGPTYGIMIYQEQAMFLAREMASLTWNEVDKLRKAISKKKGDDFVAICKVFEAKATQKGISREAINEVLHLMEKFAGYAFNKSHATGYALTSYWTAWLRRYYPHEWIAANIQIDHDDEEKMARYKRECKRDNIIIIQPNVNDSTLNTTVTNDNKIALPLTTIKGVGDLAKIIVEHKPYTDLRDLCFRAKPNRGIIESLAAGGALSCLEDVHQLDTHEIMEMWDNLVLERKKYEKANRSSSKQNFKSVSIFDNNAEHSEATNHTKKPMFLDDIFGGL